LLRQQVKREARRNRLAVLLLIVAVGLVAAGTVTSWINGRLISTTGFVSTVQSAAQSPEVVNAATTQLLTQVGQPLIEQGSTITSRATGPDGQPLDANAFTASVANAIDAAVASPTFTSVWSYGQAATQTQVVALIDGAVPTQQQFDGTQISIDLTPVSAVVIAQLVNQGYTFAASNAPAPAPLVIRTTASAAPYTKTLATIRSLWWLFPLLGVFALAGAYAASSRRLRLTLLFGVDLALAMGGVVLISRLLQNVVGERGIALPDQQLLEATYRPLGAALSRIGIIGAIIGGVIALVALVLISVRAGRERRVRSAERREALAILREAALAPPVGPSTAAPAPSPFV